MNHNIVIRRASSQDIPPIMTFIRDYWDRAHILAISREFFEYQYVYGEEVCFIIAENQLEGSLEGILGYIPYDSEDTPRDIFGAIWKVRSSQYPMLGMRMQKYAMETLHARSFSAVGINSSTADMHKRLGMQTGKMEQYYILNPDRQYSIAKVNSMSEQTWDFQDEQYEWNICPDMKTLAQVFDSNSCRERKPFKCRAFMERRYYQHPIYQYQVFGISRKGEAVTSVAVAREIACLGSKVLRLVDFIGRTEDIGHIGEALIKLVRDGGYEYVDMYQTGIPREQMERSGFRMNGKEDGNIIPNYFEPFVQENIDILYYTSAKKGICLFKGDGDQDRPSKL